MRGRTTIPGERAEDWHDCGQCRDCFLPAFNYRPRNSAQYALAITNFDDPDAPRRFRFGFIASSDNHSARPGTGYKEFARPEMTEATGPRDERVCDFGTPRTASRCRTRGPSTRASRRAVSAFQTSTSSARRRSS